MSNDKTNFALRIDKSIMDKIREIAKNESRSLNKEIEFILKQYIEDYEKTNNWHLQWCLFSLPVKRF